MDGLAWRWGNPKVADGAEPWRAWLTALQSDPDAPMPS